MRRGVGELWEKGSGRREMGNGKWEMSGRRAVEKGEWGKLEECADYSGGNRQRRSFIRLRNRCAGGGGEWERWDGGVGSGVGVEGMG
jgi:hypothetical protein